MPIKTQKALPRITRREADQKSLSAFDYSAEEGALRCQDAAYDGDDRPRGQGRVLVSFASESWLPTFAVDGAKWPEAPLGAMSGLAFDHFY